jgi:hypothetical protein
MFENEMLGVSIGNDHTIFVKGCQKIIATKSQSTKMTRGVVTR